MHCAPPPAKAGKASASALALAEASLRRETYAFKYVGTPEEARASLLVANGPEAAAAEAKAAGDKADRVFRKGIRK